MKLGMLVAGARGVPAGWRRIGLGLILVGAMKAVAAQDTNIPVAPPEVQTPPPVAVPVLPSAIDAAGAAPDTATSAAPAGGIVVVDPAESKFGIGMTAYEGGHDVEAVKAFLEFVRDYPGNRHREEALYRLAEAYRILGHASDALAAYSFQVETYPEGPLRASAELRRGALLYDAGKYAEAVAPLQFVVDKEMGQLQEAAKYLLGRSLLAAQKEPEARALLQPIADEKPAGKFTGGAAQALAELDDTQQKFAEAFPLWQTALAGADDPATKAAAAARGGWSALQAKKLDEAEKLFKTALDQIAIGEVAATTPAPKTPGPDPFLDTEKVTMTGLLRALFLRERYADWLKTYLQNSTMILDSARTEVFYDLGHAHFALKHWADAVDGFDQYLAAAGTKEGDLPMSAAYQRFLALTQMDRTKTPAEAEAYLTAFPRTPDRAQVRLLEAQELSREKKFAEALPLWLNLATVKDSGESWPRQDILLELARAYDETGIFVKAAVAYQSYLDDLKAHPQADAREQAHAVLHAQARLAVCLQKADQIPAAIEAWKGVESLAPDGSSDEETALESLGLIYAKGGPDEQTPMVETFRKLLAAFPQSPLKALAAFSVGDSLFENHDYVSAEPLLLEARDADAANWNQPATQRLLLGAYGLKDYKKTEAYLKEYDAIPAAEDAPGAKMARVPAALLYWLAETARKAGKWNEAETYYLRVTQHPEPGDLLAGAWWQLGEVQSHRGEWAAAVASYTKYRELKPEAKDATEVLLALGRAELGAADFDGAKKLAEQALLQEPEGPHSAAARMLLGESAFVAKNYAEAARQFATLAVLFDDAQTGPQATARAAKAFELAGDSKSAADWQQKLQAKYPGFVPAGYP